ncbi:MAG: hypothetical protein HPY52_16705 [Firmicutes bacterium]|nr:hypothetical protein [Bacillota bacterium]
MFRKSKSGKRKRHHQPDHRHRDCADGIERELLEPLHSRGLLKGQKVVPRPEGMEKMSEVLLEFVQPYMKSAKTRKAFDSLLAIATASWNCALLDEKGSHELSDQIVNAVVSCEDKQGQVVIRRVMNELIERKKRHFAKYDRYILNYVLSETEDGFHLSVVSTP